MQHTLNDLNDFAIHATDGIIGKIKDYYFDDRRWVVRYLVVEIGSLIESKKVLLSPSVIKHINREDKTLSVDLSLSEIKNSPHIDTSRSSSQQYEIDYLSYYGYAFYWGNNSLWDSFATPAVDANHKTDVPMSEKSAKAADTFMSIDTVRRMYGDRHLRSCDEIIGYHIQATDGEIGYLQKILIEDGTWEIHYFIASTGSWWAGRQVLVSPLMIKDISWGDAKIYVDMTQQQVQSAPLFDVAAQVNRQKELGVYLHYGREGHSKEGAQSSHIN
jgi:hypothetical protein